MELAELVYVSPLMEDKHGVPMVYGRTAEYIDNEVFYKGALVTCYNPDLFKEFKIGLKIAL